MRKTLVPRRTFVTAIAALLCAVTLTSCGIFRIEEVSPDPSTPPSEPTTSPVQPLPSAAPDLGDDRFSLRYTPSASLNPITSTDANNTQLAQLCYEGLFTLDEKFAAVPLLCAEYSTEDGMTYVFKLRGDIAMTDGTILDAYDAAYSVNQARDSARYKSRLRNIASCEATGFSELTIKLKKTDYALPTLLDFGIVKYGFMGAIPIGSGPYRYVSADGDAMLVAFESYRDYDKLSVKTIHLVECPDSSIGEYFTALTIDLIAVDPNGSLTPQIRRDHESRYYDTTAFQYIGFNPRTAAVADSRVRRAIALAVDRETIVSNTLDGRAIAAPLAFSPAHPLYNASWVPSETHIPAVEMSNLLHDAGMYDTDNDLWLDYPTFDGYEPVKLTLLVAQENPARVAAARSVADALQRVGVNVAVTEVSYSVFATRLANGSFDLYYGETRLPANFDLTELLTNGGALNFGNMGGSDYAELIDNFLASPDDATRAGAAQALCRKIYSECPIIPIAFMQHAVYSARGAIRELPLSPSGVFRRITEWTFLQKYN
ncbi:MAG: ABC transporter substrate-binding protein [Oscillospiraceae bacterium]|jgi:peptide/nickel transport system substrate-binding protein|nr:ABC transporter substrate-binding protein [Oscillospiraceae bacterium]